MPDSRDVLDSVVNPHLAGIASRSPGDRDGEKQSEEESCPAFG